MPPAAGKPCSCRVCLTAPSVASGTGFRPGERPRCWLASVLACQAALTCSTSQLRSPARRIRPDFSALRMVVSLTPSCRPSSRLLAVRMSKAVPGQALNLKRGSKFDWISRPIEAFMRPPDERWSDDDEHAAADRDQDQIEPGEGARR